MTEQATAEPEAPAASDPRVPSQALEKPAAELPAMISDDEFRRLWRVSEALAKSGLFKDARKAGEAFAKVLAGRDLGLSPFEAMAGLHVIEGKIEASSDLHATRVRQREGYDFEVYWIKSKTGKVYPPAEDGSMPAMREGERVAVKASEEDPTDLRPTVGCAIRFLVDGAQRGVSTWTVEDSIRAKLTQPRGQSGKESPHVTYPRNMYYARAMTNGTAWYVPEAMGGLRVYGAGEIAQGGAIDASPDSPLGVVDDASMAEVPWPPDQELKDEMRQLVNAINELDPNRYMPATLQMLLGGRTLVQHAEIRDRLRTELTELREKAARDEEQIEDAEVVEGPGDDISAGIDEAAKRAREDVDTPDGRAADAMAEAFAEGEEPERPPDDIADQLADDHERQNAEQERIQRETHLVAARERLKGLEGRFAGVRVGSDEHVALANEMDSVERYIRELEAGEDPGQGSLL